jgi:ribonuclease HII
VTKKAKSKEEVVRVRDLLAKSSEYIIGVDEVGTGAWAGPIFVGATVFKSDWANTAVRDSKKFGSGGRAHRKRKAVLRDLIMPNALFVVKEAASPETIDFLGVEGAREALVKMVVSACLSRYPTGLVVVDGNSTKGILGTAKAIVGADDIVPAVSAASILAKVARDNLMKNLDKVYPCYKFSKNVGYGTPDHRAALAEHGLCNIHRRSYRPVQEYEKQWLSRTHQRSESVTPGSMS